MLIKRYKNRKLYSTVESGYLTLKDVAALVREGEDVNVVDMSTKNDITAQTLTQYLWQQEWGAYVPASLDTLKYIIKSGLTMSEFIEAHCSEVVTNDSEAACCSMPATCNNTEQNGVNV